MTSIVELTESGGNYHGGGHHALTWLIMKPGIWAIWKMLTIDKFQINEINVDLRTSGFDNEVLSVDACAVW